MKIMIEHVGKDVKAAVRALQAHAAKADDPREHLRRVWVGELGGELVGLATDSFALMAVNLGGLDWPAELGPGVYDFGKGAVAAGAGPLVCERVEGARARYPDFTYTVEKVLGKRAGVVLEISPGVLSRAMKTFGLITMMRFSVSGGGKVEIGGRPKVGRELAETDAWATVKAECMTIIGCDELTVGISPELLPKALDQMGQGGSIMMVVPADEWEPVQVMGKGKEGADIWAIIMPMHKDRGGAYWRPALGQVGG